jgi:DNA-nicking Smr family endonuclease
MPKTTRSAEPARGDGALWREAVRGVTPLRGRTTPAPPTPRALTAPASVEHDETNRPPSAPPLARFAGIDRANAERLKRGLHRIEARLDLHGMTQADAHRALVTFIEASRGAGRRCVLVITGRGLSPSGSGILKSSVPRWLEEPELRHQILAIASAQPHHGGAGATYLLLRRRR